MSENEEKARNTLDKIMQLNISLALARVVFCEELKSDLSNTIWPYLSDAECLSIAKNYPFSWQEICTAFP